MYLHFTRDIITDLVIFQAVVLAILLSNAYVLHRTARRAAPLRLPCVSVLVPARNEEENIEKCVRSLLSQDYPHFEVLVLDDASTDTTLGVLERVARSESGLTVLEGEPLPEGWVGKNWACAQLAAQAAGAVLYFTDADTAHGPQALRRALTALEGERADLLTGFTSQEVRGWGEKLIVPFFGWALFCFVPLPLAYWLRLPALSGAIGQMMVFRREVYEAIGGHGSVRNSITEDLALARRIRRLGYRWRMMNSTSLVSCRMYRSGAEACAGLSKNLFAAFDYRLLPFTFAWLWLIVVFLVPIADLALYAAGLAPHVPLALTGFCVGLSLVLWLIPYMVLRAPLYLALLYPLSLVVVEYVAFRSLVLSLAGRLAWKGRALARPPWRLL